MKLRRTQVAIETHQVVVIRRRQVVRFWCSECGGESEFVPVEDLHPLLEGGVNQASSRLRDGTIHLGKARDGSVVVCVKSLPGQQ